MNKKNNFKKHFAFDFDDTLVDGRLFCGETIARSFAKLIPDIDQKAVIELHDKIRGRAIPDLYIDIAKKMNLKIDMRSNLEKLLKDWLANPNI